MSFRKSTAETLRAQSVPSVHRYVPLLAHRFKLACNRTNQQNLFTLRTLRLGGEQRYFG